MQKIAFITIILLFGQLTYSQEAPSIADLGVAAIGLVVSDIEKSEQFYTEILGMVPHGQFKLSEEWSEDAGMSNGKPFAVKMIKMADQPSATILKLAYFENTPKGPKLPGVNVQSGVNYLTLHYNDLSEVLFRIEKAGIPIIGKVKRDYKLVIIQDPDGVFIELVQLP